MPNTIIIAEAGVNHNGDIGLARQLIDVAAAAKADYVKFQTFKASKLASPHASKASYQKATTNAEENQLTMLKKLELDEAIHYELKSYCEIKGIRFLSTPFDEESISLLKQLDVEIGKIPSGEITNLPYLRHMAKSFPQLIISTGMSDTTEIQDAINALKEAGAVPANITILHCNTEYPTPMQDVNLKAMLNIADTFGCAIGYSDHTLGIEVPIAAVALGATIIEKHFTLDRNMEGPDHKASLEPAELKAMVDAIRNIELAVSGSGEKVPSASELKNKAIARKSIVSVRDLPKGHRIMAEDMVMKRPGTGISPMKMDTLIGKVLIHDVEADTVFDYSHFE